MAVFAQKFDLSHCSSVHKLDSSVHLCCVHQTCLPIGTKHQAVLPTGRQLWQIFRPLRTPAAVLFLSLQSEVPFKCPLLLLYVLQTQTVVEILLLQAVLPPPTCRHRRCWSRALPCPAGPALLLKLTGHALTAPSPPPGTAALGGARGKSRWWGGRWPPGSHTACPAGAPAQSREGAVRQASCDGAGQAVWQSRAGCTCSQAQRGTPSNLPARPLPPGPGPHLEPAATGLRTQV